MGVLPLVHPRWPVAAMRLSAVYVPEFRDSPGVHLRASHHLRLVLAPIRLIICCTRSVVTSIYAVVCSPVCSRMAPLLFTMHVVPRGSDNHTAQVQA